MLGEPLASRGVALPRRLPARAPVSLRLPDARRVPRLRRPALRLRSRAPARAHARAAGARRARALGGRADAPLLEGHGAARGPRAGAGQRPGAADPRRADVGARPDRPQRWCARSSCTSARPARRCSSRPTSSPTPRRSATASPCCAAGRLLQVGAARRAARLDVEHLEVLVAGIAPDAPARGRRPGRGGRRPLAPAGARGRARAARSLAVEAAGGRVLSVQPVRADARGLLHARDGRHRRRAGRVGRGMSRVLAVAANTFRETVRERVLYNLVFFAMLMTASGLLLGQLSIRQDAKIIKDIGLAAMDLFGTADRRVHRHRPREQGDRTPLALPAARQAALPGRVLPGQVRWASPSPSSSTCQRDDGGLYLTLLPTGQRRRRRCCSPPSTRSSSGCCSSLRSPCCSRPRLLVHARRRVHGRGRCRRTLRGRGSQHARGRARRAAVAGRRALLRSSPTSRNFDFKDRVAYGDPVPASGAGVGRPSTRCRTPSSCSGSGSPPSARGTSSEAPGLPLVLLPLAPLVPLSQARIDARLGAYRRAGGGAVPLVGPARQAAVSWLRGARRRRLLAAHRPVLRERAPVRHGQRFELLRPLIGITTDLDPRLEIAYRYGAIFLCEAPPEGRGRPRDGSPCSRRASGGCPRSWRLARPSGSSTSSTCTTPSGLPTCCCRRRSIPGAAFWLRSMAADLLAKGGDRAELARGCGSRCTPAVGEPAC